MNLAGRLGQVIGRHENLGVICDEIHQHLSVATPGVTLVIYQYLSTPILAEGKLVGVLTAYSTNEPFAARDVALFEMLADLLAPLVAADALACGRQNATSPSRRHPGSNRPPASLELPHTAR